MPRIKVVNPIDKQILSPHLAVWWVPNSSETRTE